MKFWAAFIARVVCEKFEAEIIKDDEMIFLFCRRLNSLLLVFIRTLAKRKEVTSLSEWAHLRFSLFYFMFHSKGLVIFNVCLALIGNDIWLNRMFEEAFSLQSPFASHSIFALRLVHWFIELALGFDIGCIRCYLLMKVSAVC